MAWGEELVLMAGTCSRPLVSPLARGIMQLRPDSKLAVLNESDPWGDADSEETKGGFSEYRYSPFTSSTGSGRLGRKLRRAAINLAVKFGSSRLWRDASIVHWHGLFRQPVLPVLSRLGSHQKLLVSIWGSDLMRSTGVRNFRWQRVILERADVITVHGLEMKQILLAKFGWDLEPKIRLALFGAGDAQLDEIAAQAHPEARERFLSKLNIPVERTIVCVGHNGNPANRQLEVVQALSVLPVDAKREMTLLFPASYGASTSSIESLSEASKACGFDYKVLTEYLEDADVARLRHASDILIFVPRTDAMSAALSQTMAAGNVVIAGGWLPYAAKRHAGIYFREIESVDRDLSSTVEDVLSNLGREQNRCLDNPVLISERFSTSANIGRWLEVYDELAA